MGQFGKIPDFIILKKVRLKPTERDIYEYLCFRRNEKTGKCFPSVSRIAADLGIKQRHVYEARAALKELGLISWRKDERGRCHYTLHPPLPKLVRPKSVRMPKMTSPLLTKLVIKPLTKLDRQT